MISRTIRKRSSALQIDDADFLIVDVETTGLSADRGDRVCEIGAVKLRGGAVVETFGTLVDPRRPVSAGAYAVNHISPQMLQNAPVFPQAAVRLKEMMAGSILVAYNAPFDLSFLASEFRMAGFPPIRNAVVDALAMARQILPGLDRYPQDNVARVLGVPSPVRHRALEDAMITAQIFTLFATILKAHDCGMCSDLSRRDLWPILHERRLGIVNEALGRKCNLWIRYLSPSEGEISDRIVTPRECREGQFGRGSTLIGYCHSTQSERRFTLDRILDIRPIDGATL